MRGPSSTTGASLRGPGPPRSARSVHDSRASSRTRGPAPGCATCSPNRACPPISSDGWPVPAERVTSRPDASWSVGVCASSPCGSARSASRRRRPTTPSRRVWWRCWPPWGGSTRTAAPVSRRSRGPGSAARSCAGANGRGAPSRALPTTFPTGPVRAPRRGRTRRWTPCSRRCHHWSARSCVPATDWGSGPVPAPGRRSVPSPVSAPPRHVVSRRGRCHVFGVVLVQLATVLPGNGSRSPIAQLAEHSTVNRRVSGSSPDGGARPGPVDHRCWSTGPVAVLRVGGTSQSTTRSLNQESVT